MVGGDGSEFYFSHRLLWVKRMDQAIIMAPKEKTAVTTKSRGTYCESTRYKVTDRGDFQSDYLRPQPQKFVRQPLPPLWPTRPLSDQMDQDGSEEELFDGYDMPGGAQGGKTGGAGGGQPPRGRNVAGGDDPGDSSSSSSYSDGSDASPPNLRDFLASRKRHWSREKPDKYDRRYAALNKVIQECDKAKKSSYRHKKPEKLGVDHFTGDPKDTQRFVHDGEIKLDYFRDSLVKEIDKVSLVIPLLRDTVKEWYNAIHPHMNKDPAIRRGIKFDPKNELRTWEGIRKRLEGSFGGHSDRNHALREWSQMYLKDGKVDRFIDELIRLAAVLGYSGEFVKEEHAWA